MAERNCRSEGSPDSVGSLPTDFNQKSYVTGSTMKSSKPIWIDFIMSLMIHSPVLSEDRIRAIGTPEIPSVLADLIEMLKEGATLEELSETLSPVQIGNEVYLFKLFRFGGPFLEDYPPTPGDHTIRYARPVLLSGGCSTLGVEYKGLTSDPSKVVTKPIGCIGFYDEKHCFAAYYFLCEKHTPAELHRIRRNIEKYE